MPRTQALYYRDKRGRQPLEEFIDGLPPRHQVVVDRAIDRLNGLHPSEPPLAFPATSQIAGELRELRCHYGPLLYRVLYQRSKNLFILLHMLRKNSGKILQADIETARTRWDVDGLAYIPLSGDWEKLLVRELRDADWDFRLDRLHA